MDLAVQPTAIHHVLLGGQLPGGLWLPDRVRELLEWLQAWLLVGGLALAAAGALLFLGSWVLAHLRRPAVAAAGPARVHGLAAHATLWTSAAPIALTLAAAATSLLPPLAPFTLRMFAGAVAAAALTWLLAVGVIAWGGRREALARARRALLLAGTPWYCLLAWLAARM